MTTFNFNTKLLTLRGKYLSTWIEQTLFVFQKTTLSDKTLSNVPQVYALECFYLCTQLL